MFSKLCYILLSLIFIAGVSTFLEFNDSSNKCNSTCLDGNLNIAINDENCLSWEEWPNILKPKNFTVFGKECILLNKESEILVCPKIINGTKMLASCVESSSIDDSYCIPAAEDLYQWYRGIKSTTFNGRKCLRWDEIDFIGNKFSRFFDFGPSTAGSQTYGIHSHENFCRNPDFWIAGPWCYIKGGEHPLRQPCFFTCNSTMDFPDEIYHPISPQQKLNETSEKEGFEDQLDTGNPIAAILLILVSSLLVIAAMIVCILHACDKI